MLCTTNSHLGKTFWVNKFLNKSRVEDSQSAVSTCFLLSLSVPLKILNHCHITTKLLWGIESTTTTVFICKNETALWGTAFSLRHLSPKSTLLWSPLYWQKLGADNWLLFISPLILFLFKSIFSEVPSNALYLPSSFFIICHFSLLLWGQNDIFALSQCSEMTLIILVCFFTFLLVFSLWSKMCCSFHMCGTSVS